MTNNTKHSAEMLSVAEYIRIIWNHKILLFVLVVILTALSITYSMFMPDIYRSRAVIMPVGGKSGIGGMMGGQLGGLASLVGLSGGGAPQSLQFIGLMETREIARRVVEKNNLDAVLFQNKQSGEGMPAAVPDERGRQRRVNAAVGILRGAMDFKNKRKYGTVLIIADYTDPEMAMNFVNWYIEALQDILNENAFTVDKKSRIFIEEQLAQNEVELLQAGKELSHFYKDGRISAERSTLDVPVSMKSSYHYSDLETSDGADSNHTPRQQLAQLMNKKEQLDAVMADMKGTAGGDEVLVKDVPQQVYLQYLSMRKHLLEKINGLLTQQYIMAKIEEAKDEFSFQVIDPPIKPMGKFKPNRQQIGMFAFIGSIFLAAFVVILLEHLKMANILPFWKRSKSNDVHRGVI